MTDEAQNNQTEEQKEKPAYYIFKKGNNGSTSYVGAAFNHAAGKGINILIGKDRYVAFPPKPKPEGSA